MFILAKVFLFKFYQREFGEMYESMENNWRQAKYLNSEKKRIMSDDLQQSQKLVKYWALHFSAFLVLVLVLPLLRILILHEPLKLNIDVWDSFHTSPGFELAMVLQTVVELYNCLALISLECSFLITTSHCSAQLKILCHSIEQYDGLITHDNCEEQLNCACIRCVVRRHEEIMKFFGLLRKCFNSAISLNLILAESYLCVFIAMGSKQAEHQSGLYPAICWSFTMIMIVVGFIYCHIGEKITQESLNVSNAFFNCHWYESEASKAKYYVTPMIISRSIPMEITVGIFYKLSHELFKNCIFLAYSVFSLFRTISEKQNAIVK
ncbi:odorant receptor 43a-like isoform X2 [Fopius arisanus]|nr:PREDICTED: odorant receptor 43a-like isoform X2 [Fopius arisanus]